MSIVVFSLLLTPAVLAQAVAPKQRALTADAMVTALTSAKTGLATANLILTKQIEEFGIDFELDSNIEKALTAAGASNGLLTTIKIWLCELYTKRASECSENDTDCQLKNYSKGLGFHPNDNAVLVNRGNGYYQLQQYDTAINDF